MADTQLSLTRSVAAQVPEESLVIAKVERMIQVVCFRVAQHKGLSKIPLSGDFLAGWSDIDSVLGVLTFGCGSHVALGWRQTATITNG